MKKLYMLLVVFAVLISCGKSDPECPSPQPEQPKQETISIAGGSDTVLVLGTTGGTSTVIFTASAAWSASVINTRAIDWCSVSPTNGQAGTATISITVKENTAPDNRAASVIIKCGNATSTIKVEQKQKDALMVSQSSFEVPAEGTEIKVVAKSNVSFTHTISTGAQSWIKPVVTKALKDSILTFEIAKNDNVEKRSGEIYFTSGNLKDTVKVYQAGEIPSIVISQDEYVLKSEGESFVVEVASNLNSTMNLVFPEGIEPWIAENTTRAMSTNKYFFVAEANEMYDPRSAIIIFFNAENNVSDTVRVIQAQKDAIVVAKSSYNVENAGGTIEIEVGYNVDYEYIISSDWISKVDTKAMSTDKLLFAVSENTSYENREGTIVFTANSSTITQEVKVIQRPMIYESSDFSADGLVRALQTATIGNGIDIVLMGDGFSDRLIANGTYDECMTAVMESFFTVEPFKYYRNYFNVFSVKAVSKNEIYMEGTSTGLLGYFGAGTHVGGDDDKAFEYAQKAIGEERIDNALLVVVMNSKKNAGTCYMYADVTGDYGNGVSVSYLPLGPNRTNLEQTLHHEACGHGFAKLGDEYFYHSNGAINSKTVMEHKSMERYGWWKNVDFTDNRYVVKWAHFLEDSRYNYDGLGIFAGGLTYTTGVWRPTENSIMNDNTGGFNAPSREAIYYRIHKLAYGAKWEYDYEAFVEYDARNRRTEAQTRSLGLMEKSKGNLVPTHPPVIVPYSWRRR